MSVGRVFWYVVGRFYAWEEAGTTWVQDVGYFVRLGPVEPMFRPPPTTASGEQLPAKRSTTAHYTFWAEPFAPETLGFDDSTRSALSASLDPPGSFHLYYNPEPGGARFDHPDSFKTDTRIASFERIGKVVGASTSTGTANLFSARLLPDTVDFPAGEHPGPSWNLAKLLDGAVTQMGSGGPPDHGLMKRTKADGEPISEVVSVRDFVGSAFEA